MSNTSTVKAISSIPTDPRPFQEFLVDILAAVIKNPASDCEVTEGHRNAIIRTFLVALREASDPSNGYGPPQEANTAFYHHHTDPTFAMLHPNVELSDYSELPHAPVKATAREFSPFRQMAQSRQKYQARGTSPTSTFNTSTNISSADERDRANIKVEEGNESGMAMYGKNVSSSPDDSTYGSQSESSQDTTTSISSQRRKKPSIMSLSGRRSSRPTEPRRYTRVPSNLGKHVIDANEANESENKRQKSTEP